jgi:threonine dehydrogenase-like Zn-dependent dehydrogenase
VVVFGCGPLGLLCMAVAKAYGARTIIAVDISTKRLEFARSYAATHTFLPSRKPQEKDVMDWNVELAAQVLKDAGVQSGVDVAIEASGAEPCMQLAITMLRTGGTCKHTTVLSYSELKNRFTSGNGCPDSLFSDPPSRNEGAGSQGDLEVYNSMFRRRHRST